MKTKSNNFLTTGIVIYEDEIGNTIFVKSDRRGNELTIRPRYHDKRFEFEIMKFSYPFNLEGANVNISVIESEKENITASELDDISESIIWEEIQEIAEKWIIISKALKTFYSSKEMNILSSSFERIEPTYSKQEYTEGLLLQTLDILSEYEEMNDFLTFCRYKKDRKRNLVL